MRENNDGFAIAEADLKLRGEGEILGSAKVAYQNLNFLISVMKNLLQYTKIYLKQRTKMPDKSC